MIKLLLFSLLCGLGYRLIRAFGGGPRHQEVDDHVPANLRAVDAEFEELEEEADPPRP